MALEAGLDPLTHPLWPGDIPPELAKAETEGLEHLAEETGDRNSFWHRWWFAMKRGEPMDWALQRDVALIPEEVWKAGAKAVGAEIAKIEARYALAVTDNAEVIEPNPETGKLRLVPTSTLPADLGDYARRKMLKATELFDDPAARQQYGAIAPDLAMLRAAVADAGNLPVELYDACASASRRLTIRAGGGECPSPDMDPLLADYRNRLVDVSADSHPLRMIHEHVTIGIIAAPTGLADRGMRQRSALAIVMPRSAGSSTKATMPCSLDGQMATDPQADPELRIARFVVGLAADLYLRCVRGGCKLQPETLLVAGQRLLSCQSWPGCSRNAEISIAEFPEVAGPLTTPSG